MPDDGSSIRVSSGARLDQSYTHSESKRRRRARRHPRSPSLSLSRLSPYCKCQRRSWQQPILASGWARAYSPPFSSQSVVPHPLLTLCWIRNPLSHLSRMHVDRAVRLRTQAGRIVKPLVVKPIEFSAEKS